MMTRAMRRVARHFFTTLSLISLLLFSVVSVLWVRSFQSGGDQLIHTLRNSDPAWGPSHYSMGPSRFPVLSVIEKYTAASSRGRVRLRHISWFAQDHWLHDGDLFGGGAGVVERPPVPIQNLVGVSPTPGWAHDAGDAMHLDLWLEHRETSWPKAGFLAESGYWDQGFSGGLGPVGEWSAYERRVEFPHWWLALATALLPTLWIHRAIVRRRRFGQGRCTECGYDLRATPERCPECGNLATSRASSIS
jgi:hypothetical protein